MKFAAILKSLMLLTAVSLLAACGGGSSGGDSAFQPATIRVVATPTATSVRSGEFIEVAVRVTQASGANVADGTVVNSTVTPASNGNLQVSNNGTLGGTSGGTVGGVVNFRFTGAGTGGNTTLTFSVPDTAAPSRSVSTTVTINVTPLPAVEPGSLSIELVPEVIPVNGRADIRVKAVKENGQLVADGTTVSAQAFPSSLGSLTSTSATTLAGYALFTYQAQGAAGEAELTFSAVTEEGAATSTAKKTLVIAQIDDARLKLQATRTTLPVNIHGISPFMGSPYMAEVTVTVKDSNGQPVNAENGIQVSINPVGNTGGFSTLDDPSTDCNPEEGIDGCEFLIRMGQGPVDVTAGKATIFVHSMNATGKATLTVTMQDPTSGHIVAAALEFETVAATSDLPSALSLTGPSTPIYVQNSGGNNSGLLNIEVTDAIGQPVPDPVSGSNAFNNYRLEIVRGSDVAAKISGINAQGESVSGARVNLRTTNGVGIANFIAGNNPESFVVRLTADRADNNVDNGINDPVSVERSVLVSDGRLYDLQITQPIVNALTINPNNGDIELNDDGLAIPPSPDATYSVTVSVIATDRQGNPVLPGTQINFGLIDEPQATGVGDYYIAGGDGDPEEGGTVFRAINGQFKTAGGGVGPGDTLVVFGEDVVGNREMESARTVREVFSETSLGVDYRFNLNDTTGVNVDYQGILPYIVGRAADGNIVATATTNEIGVAVTKMNYPVSKLGKVAVIWAQGDRAMDAGGSPRKVTDVEFAYFSGVAPAMLVVSPASIPANTTRDVTICLYDALSAPIGGYPIDFAFQGLSGSGSVDGISSNGIVENVTEFGSGCTTARVSTQGVLEDGEPLLVFSAAGAQAQVEFTFSSKVLLANPTYMSASGTVTLTLVDASGSVLPNFQIVGSCTSANGARIAITSGPGVTNANGQTTAFISAVDLNQVASAGSGVCTFETVDGEASANVVLQGRDICIAAPSPLPPGCPSSGE